jgi:hypothetical protein
MNNTNAASNSSSPSQPRPVGSNRFVWLSIVNSNIYIVYFLLDSSYQRRNSVFTYTEHIFTHAEWLFRDLFY